MPDAAAMRICRHGCGAVDEPGSCHGNRTWVDPASSPSRARRAGLACAISLRFHAALSSVNEFRHGLLRSSRVQRDGCATSASDACTRSDARRGRCAAREWMQRGVGTVMRATTQAEMPIAHENVVFLRGGRFVVAPPGVIATNGPDIASSWTTLRSPKRPSRTGSHLRASKIHSLSRLRHEMRQTSALQTNHVGFRCVIRPGGSHEDSPQALEGS